MKKIFAGLGIFFAITAYAFTEVDRQELITKNLVRNGGFENGLANWSVLNGAISSTSNRGAVAFGNAAAIITPNGTAPATFKTNDFVLSGGLYNNTCLARIAYRGNANRYAFSVLADTGATIFGSVLNNNSNYARTSMSFPCPTQSLGGGRVRAQVVSYGKDTNSVLIDDVFLGEDTTTITQASAVWMGYHDRDCQWDSSAVTTYADFPTADGACTATEAFNRGMGAVTSTTELGTSASRKPDITFTPPRTGVYSVDVTVYHSDAGNYSELRVVNQSGVEVAPGIAQLSSAGVTSLQGVLSVSSLSATTLKLQGASSSSTTRVGDQTTSVSVGVRAISWVIKEIK